MRWQKNRNEQNNWLGNQRQAVQLCCERLFLGNTDLTFYKERVLRLWQRLTAFAAEVSTQKPNSKPATKVHWYPWQQHTLCVFHRQGPRTRSGDECWKCFRALKRTEEKVDKKRAVPQQPARTQNTVWWRMLEMFSSPEENRREGGQKEGSTATACKDPEYGLVTNAGNVFEPWREQKRRRT